MNMQFKLDRDLVFFDLEATGLNVIRDRIVQVAMVKYFSNGEEPAEISMLVNPGIPISEEAMGVHGITPKDLANKPTFEQVADQLFNFIGDADLAGYNSNRFDIPLLMEEFARVGIEFNVDNRRTIDVQRIFYRMEPRTLRAALKFYCDKELEDAHDALADVKATVDVLKGQIHRYDGVDLVGEDERLENPVRNDMQKLHEFTNDARIVDATQRLKRNSDGIIVFNFGKYLNQPVAETLSKDKQYYHWILNKEFSSQVKQLVKKLVKEYEQG
jgi:DNA polymerase-3 subunit epsilon